MVDESPEPSPQRGGPPAPSADSTQAGGTRSADEPGSSSTHDEAGAESAREDESTTAHEDAHDDEADDDAYDDELEFQEGAEETRGWHFARLAFHPVTLSYGTIAAIALFSILTVVASPLAGAIGAAVVLVLTYAIVFVLAGRRVGEDFYGLYAEERGLERSPHGSIPRVTPLLRRGDRRATEQVMTGRLPGGLTGTLALHTYELDILDSDGEPDVDYFDYTVTLADLPETAANLTELSCERRSGFGTPEDDPARRTRRLALGNEAFDSRYEIRFDPRDDERRLRNLFSAEFTNWLTDDAPPDLAFELAAGSLCVYVEDHMDSVEELDELCEAAAVVANRLREAARG